MCWPGVPGSKFKRKTKKMKDWKLVAQKRWLLEQIHFVGCPCVCVGTRFTVSVVAVRRPNRLLPIIALSGAMWLPNPIGIGRNRAKQTGHRLYFIRFASRWTRIQTCKQIFKQFQPFPTIFNNFQPRPNNFQPFPTILNHFQPKRGCLNMFCTKPEPYYMLLR